jgi:UDP-N-acetyl-D-galactosamine dehydrogenase
MMSKKIAIIGLGYVGLPLANAFSEKFKVIGYDNDIKKVEELNNGVDKTNQLGDQKLKSFLNRVKLTNRSEEILGCNVYIITVPTPVNNLKKPDLSYLLGATKMVGAILKQGDIIIYESTVYPGCTEDDCVPLLEAISGLKYNQDFFCGYSPERINPGDKINTLTNIIKVTSGSTPKIAELVDSLYKEIIKAGTYKASSIKVAEASKAIENAQRDINISFMNELALIFDKMEIDTTHVLEAASTKWNFIPFKPGLVGGHCISVDPYFLTHKAVQLGYTPEVILSGRNVNDSIPAFIVRKVLNLMRKKEILIKGAKALIMGITFKENLNDIRNSKVPEIYKGLVNQGLEVEVYDPLADSELVQKEYGISLTKLPSKYEVIILAVAHEIFLNNNIEKYKNLKGAVVYDIKSVLGLDSIDGRL